MLRASSLETFNKLFHPTRHTYDSKCKKQSFQHQFEDALRITVACTTSSICERYVVVILSASVQVLFQ